MKVITKQGYFEQNINKSRFLGFAYSVKNEDEAQKIIKQIENKYCDARHVVFAYKIEPNIEKKGNSSEPAGTAGAPIFSAIEKNDLTNTLIVVVRYFGGILLGAQNLYRAYASTALGAIENCEIQILRKYITFRISSNYSDFNHIMAIVGKTNNVKVLDTVFEENVEFTIALVDINENEFIKQLIQKQNCKGEEKWL